MSLAQLLQQTAARYEAAVQQVLQRWRPDCGCLRPGSQPSCNHCPCRIKFIELVRLEICSMLNAAQTHSESPHEP